MSNELTYEKINEEINNYYSCENKNIWRNNFHIEMPFGLVNDPNGLSYFNGEYYIFYQWNPFGCEHKTKHWGLVKTKDFVNFTKPEIILKPEEWFDKNGCYSGGAYVKDNILKLFYTGNVKGPSNERESYQCLAELYEDGSFRKKGVLIEKQPDGYTAHFRDPMIFEENNKYYMILGIQTEDLKGRAVLYESDDIEKWSYLGELNTDMKDFGYMWECPNMFKVSEDKYAFLFSPQGLKEEEFKYQNIYQTGYVVGDLNLSNVSLTNTSQFKEIDMGFDFYAPQVFNHGGKNIMIGWIGMPDKDNEYVSSKDGWMLGLTMPRILEYKENVLYQKPLKLVENLRVNKVIDLKNIRENEYILKPESKCIECIFELDLKNKIDIRFSFKDEYISLMYDKNNEICILDRSNMHLGGKGIRKFYLKTEDKLKLHIFIDNSIMEIYYQDGIEATTLMYFPENNDFQIEIRNNTEIHKLQMWNLRGINYEK